MKTRECGKLMHATAVHEAAHAVLGHLRGEMVREKGLTANSDGTGLTHTRTAVWIPFRSSLPAALLAEFDASMEMECAVHIGGYVAEKRLTRERWKPWGSVDYLDAARVVNQYMGRPLNPIGEDLVMWLYLDALERLVRRVLRRQGVWTAVITLAEAVMSRAGFIEGEHATRMLQELLPGSWTPFGRRAGEKPRRAGVFGDAYRA